MNDITLLRTEINSFKGIDSSKPMILDFTQINKKNKPIVKFEGNQATGKTSTIEALLYLMGVSPDFGMEHLVNTKDGTINLEQEFMVESERYRVRATKSRFVLERFVDTKGDGNGKWYGEEEPKTTLRKLIGNIGVSPMKLKHLDGDKQIDWFRDTFSTDTEKLKKKEHLLRQTLKSATKNRTEANREYRRIKAALEENPYYTEREKWDSQFKDKKISKEQAEERFNAAQRDFTGYTANQNALPIYDEKIALANEEITRLEKQLQDAKAKKDVLVSGKATCEKWLNENESILTEYAQAKEVYMNVSEMLVKQHDYRLMVTSEEQMHDYETLIQRADSQKDDMREQLRELTKQYLPGIPGLEIKVASGLDDEEEGIFYQGKSLVMLSESEIWQLFFLIWQDKDVPFVFVENIQDLGSHAIEILNNMVKNGVKVFASAMDRKKDSVKVSIVDEIKL